MKNSHRSKILSNLSFFFLCALIFVPVTLMGLYWILTKMVTTETDCTIKTAAYEESGGGGKFSGHSPKILLTCPDQNQYIINRLPQSQGDFHEFNRFLGAHVGEKVKLKVGAIRDPIADVYYVNSINLTSLEE